MNGKIDFLTQIAHALAKQFGDSCEIVIHDLVKSPYESSIIFIENGHVTNRKVGDGPSSAVLEALSKKTEEVEDRLCYLTQGPNGKIFKSSTIYIKDDDKKVIGILGINYDISSLITFQNVLQDFITVDSTNTNDTTYIPRDVNDLLNNLIERAVNNVGRPVAFMSREDKIKAIQFLHDSGAFLIKKSGDIISNYFGISKYSIYNYIEKEK